MSSSYPDQVSTRHILPNPQRKIPRRSQIRAKRAIYGWKLIKNLPPKNSRHLLFLFVLKFYKKLFQILRVVKYRFRLPKVSVFGSVQRCSGLFPRKTAGLFDGLLTAFQSVGKRYAPWWRILSLSEFKCGYHTPLPSTPNPSDGTIFFRFYPDDKPLSNIRKR